jgi:hypothetical protein
MALSTVLWWPRMSLSGAPLWEIAYQIKLTWILPWRRNCTSRIVKTQLCIQVTKKFINHAILLFSGLGVGAIEQLLVSLHINNLPSPSLPLTVPSCSLLKKKAIGRLDRRPGSAAVLSLTISYGWVYMLIHATIIDGNSQVSSLRPVMGWLIPFASVPPPPPPVNMDKTLIEADSLAFGFSVLPTHWLIVG